MSNRKPLSVNINKKLFIELTAKKYGHMIDPNSANKVINELQLNSNNSYKITDVRDSTKSRGKLDITVYEKISIPETPQPYEKEAKKLVTHPNGVPKRIEYYDKTPGLPDRSKSKNTLPAVIEWWPNGNKRRETWLQHNVKHRSEGPAEIYYDESGNVEKENFFTLGVSKDRIAAGQQQEKEFNQARDEKHQKQDFDRKAKIDAKKKEIADRYSYNTRDLKGPQSAASAKPMDVADTIEAPNPNQKTQVLPPLDWKEKSPDSRQTIDLPIMGNDSTGKILNQPLGAEKKPLEMSNTERGIKPPGNLNNIPHVEKPSSDFGDVPKDIVKGKGIHNKIIDYISKFLTNKHKDKLSPEAIQRISDYYNSKYLNSNKETPAVPDKYRKEMTGRKRDQFDLSVVEQKEIDLFIEELLVETIELTDSYLTKLWRI